MAVIAEGVAMLNLTVNPTNGEIHLRKAPRRVVGLLPVNGQVPSSLPAIPVAAGVCPDELRRLHEHARGAATGVVHSPPEGLQHLHQEFDDAAGRVELSAVLAFSTGEPGKEELVDPPQNVLGTSLGVADLDVTDHVNQLTQSLLVQIGASVILGQHVFETGIVPLYGHHGGVHRLPNCRLPSLCPNNLPASLRRHPENVVSTVLIGVVGTGTSQVMIGLQSGSRFFERVGDVLQEDEAQDHMLVLRGVHAAAQRVGHAPQLGLVAYDRPVSVRLLCRHAEQSSDRENSWRL